MSALREKLLDVFEVEHREHSEAIRRILSNADSLDEGPGNSLTEATRRAHSLKGAARAVGLEAVEELAHELEALFIQMDRGEAKPDAETRRHVNKTLDEIEDLVAGPAVPAVSEAATQLPAAAAAAPAGEAEPASPVPAPGDADPFDVAQSGVTPSDAGLTDPATPDPAEPARKPQSDTVRVDTEDLDRLLRSAGELHTDMLFQNVGAQDIRSLSLKLTTLENQWHQIWRQVEKNTRGTAGMPTQLLGNGGQVASQFRTLSKELRMASQRQAQGAKSLRHHLNELERRVMAARMVPAESVFGGFRKMIRDVAASEGKQVEIAIDGLDCEADRLVLQRIKDPVMHMLRNAVSHGIEPPEERRRNGKAPQGLVGLGVSGEQDRLHIVVDDDGRGIDFRRIAEKAVEQNRLGREEARTANEQALCRFLFEPGFSTAEAVTTISGRGVGLSVAHETVSDLQGTIEVSARPGGGTRIEVSLPVGILARRLLLVSLKEQVFALPCESIARVLRVNLSDIAALDGRPVVRLKDSTVPLTSIGELLDLSDTIVTAGRSAASIVILRKGGAQIGVAVEEFVGVNDFVVRQFETGSRRRRRWMGLITTEDGKPCLVMNSDALLGSDIAKQASGIVFETQRKDAARSKVIMVVDDSITTRTLEKSILEAHGYRVRLSVDGSDALSQIRSEPPDIVVSDIEMPHMDGFELLRSIKADKQLSSLPVILVTSRSDADDRQRGLTLGADAYVVKQRFDQNDLLQTIGQII